MQFSSSLVPILQQKLSEKFSVQDKMDLHPVGGGSINATYRLQYGTETLFCKVNSASKFPHLFQKEKHGLALLAQTKTLQTPAVIGCFENGEQQVLLLQWIEEGERNKAFWKTFGQQLALLHQVTNTTFGLNENNYMGSVPQANTLHKNWSAFFGEERLTPMVKRCADKKLLTSLHLQQFDQLQKRLPQFFEAEPPALLHGDLWSGNFLCSQASTPVLIDPAVYYGHRSVDLAMTTLFGGFHSLFYEAYQDHFPLPKNYREQWAVCNLYPLLIHLYLFGSGYLSQINRTLQQFA